MHRFSLRFICRLFFVMVFALTVGLFSVDCSDDSGGGPADAAVDAASSVDADLSQFDHPARVLQIYDGDTLMVSFNGESIKIRVAGIDTPEVSPEPEPYGPEAEEFTRYEAPILSWIGLEFDDEACADSDPPAHCYDVYDRLLAYIRTADGDDLGILLLASGLAEVYHSADFDRKSEYQDTEDYARAHGVGIWSQ